MMGARELFPALVLRMLSRQLLNRSQTYQIQYSSMNFLPPIPVTSQSFADNDDGFFSLQINNELEHFLPPPSPSLGSTPMDILEPATGEINIGEPAITNEDADL